MGFRLWLSREMGRRLGELPVDIAWSSTWSPYVDDVIAGAVGLPRGLPVAAAPPGDGEEWTSANWKLAGVQSFLADQERPFIWLDDDALDLPGSGGETPREWAKTLQVQSLLVAPSPVTGLRPDEIDAIATWLGGVSLDVP